MINADQRTRQDGFESRAPAFERQKQRVSATPSGTMIAPIATIRVVKQSQAVSPKLRAPLPGA